MQHRHGYFFARVHLKDLSCPVAQCASRRSRAELPSSRGSSDRGLTGLVDCRCDLGPLAGLLVVSKGFDFRVLKKDRFTLMLIK